MNSILIAFALIASTSALGQSLLDGPSRISPGVYNSSNTPKYLPWDTYNYCNAPHVSLEHYERPTPEAELLHIVGVIRHHKVRRNVFYSLMSG